MKKLYILILVTLFQLNLSSKVKAQTYCLGDSILLNALDYVSGSVQWQQSVDDMIWYDINGATSLTYMVYPTASMYYRLLVTDSSCLPAYTTISKFVLINQPPSVANAGNDQLNLSGNNASLSANTPASGTGLWSVTSGGGGSFNNASNPQANFTGLSGVVYTLRWTISNACGANYDEVNISFSAGFQCGDTLIDARDNQKYATVLIGSQCWLKKDMNYGQLLNTATPQTDNGIIEKYCYDNNLSNCDNYGALYTWDEAMQYSTTQSVQGICPTGWHIPSDAEWKTLEMTLGMTQAEADLSNTWRGVGIGTAMKVGGSSGFEAKLGGGLWGAGGSSMFINSMYYVWTSTESGSNGWRRCLSATDDKVGRWDTFPKYYGFSVRCVKN